MAITMLARGSEQRYWLRTALGEHGAPSAERHLKGRAKRYGDRYRLSQYNLFARMRKAGYIVIRVTGPRGGEWGARYFAQLGLEDCEVR